MSSLGSELRHHREARNISLTQVADETRISIRHLRSLEEDRYGDLPGGMYNRAFLRTYCTHLGLDAKDYLARYERETGTVPERPARPPITPVYTPPKSHPLAIWAIGLILSVAGLFVSRDWISSVFSPYFTRPAEPAMVRTAPPAGTATIRLEPITDVSDAATATAPISLETIDPSRLESDPESLATQVLQGRFQLSVDVVADCWVSLQSDGNKVLVRLLKPGEGHTYAANEGFYLVLGNAAGVHLKINGQPLKPLGKPGSVVKLQITEQNLHELLEKSTS